ncbi:serine/threonine-protein kinase [Isoptericola jiangsuensis]|uniref:non-specific serine/threonine protein kinase n=1 Tax=Isoptericola jiangsuensis TaxID=548579 RepID=A0A2A9EYU4_9MICO|nr:Stk1 family PASTA domain-containing Ser/Thr kinase [Isoptericola jiangsuensis]PFG43482.1 serine/threonine-protein kinase [Isoptericola jiangsuensis]
MATTTTDPQLGRLVDGRYEIVARVARGGMATVYRARDRRLGREVAVKIMHPHLAEGVDGASFVSRFRREARASARLSHPGVVAVFDQGVDGDTSYLTMEYVPGHNLRSELRDGPLPVGRALDVTVQVLAALGAAHRVGLVHRDVKPENVLVDDEDRVKVADFGLARAVTEVTSTATGTILGTVAYLAPEVITSGGCTPATDVYAVGVLLHEMLTGTLPYPGETPVQVAFRHVHEDLPPPSVRVPWLPAEVDALVASFTARDAARRPAHAGAALAALRALRASLADDVLARAAVPGAGPAGPAPADGADGPDAPGPGTEAPAAPAGAAGAASADDVDEIPAAFFADVATTGQVTEHLVAEPTTALPAETPVRRRRRGRVVVAWVCVLVTLAGGGVGGWWWFTDGPGAWTDVPTGLVGAAVQDAETRLDRAGLGGRTTETYHDDVAAGEVVSTEPGTGEPVRRDGVVTLVVSLGVEMLTVPAGLVGSAQDDAEAALADAGFTVGPSSGAYDDEAPRGEVLEVSVKEGSTQPHDTAVRLTVSQGPAPVQVPQVVGRSQEDAEGDLAAAGLRVDYADPEHSTDVAEGNVLRQDPEQGSDAVRTDTITLTLSAGPREVAVPDVVGMSEQEATDALVDAGFDVEVNRYLGGLLDTVRFQDVDGKAPEGSTVTLTVW